MDIPAKRILLVEDSEVDYLIACDLLAEISSFSAEIEWVTTYEAAHTAFTQGQYDVCLLDYHLVGHTGLEFVEELAADSPVPIILLTGSEDYHVDVAATRAGASDYLVKEHINAPLLERSIRYAIQRKASEVALIQAQRLAQATVDALSDNITVLDEQGVVVAVNAAWRNFAQTSSFIGSAATVGANYLAICEASERGLEDARVMVNGIRAVITGEQELFSVCYGSVEPHWFEMRVTRFSGSGPRHVVVAHKDITTSKLSEAQLQIHSHLLSVIGQAVIVTDGTGTITYWNHFAEELYGWPASEVVGRSILDVTPNNASQEQAAQILARLAEGNKWEGEFLVQRRDGTTFPAYVTNTAVRDGMGQVVSIIGLSIDISERKEVEERLRASESRLQSMIANTPGTVYQFMLRPDGGVEIPFVSEGCRELFEMEPEELQRNPTFPGDIIHPDDRIEQHRSVIESMQTLAPWNCQWRLQLPSGKTKWVQGAARPQRLLDGSTLWDGLLLDITARKEAEEQRDRFFTLSLEMLAIAGFDGYFKRINPAFLETLGWTEAEFLSTPFLELSHPDDAAATQAVVEKLGQGNIIVGFENRYRTKQGDWRWLEWKSVAVPEEGLIYAAARDVTERKETEATLHRLRDELEVRVQERTAELEQTNAALLIQIAERKEAEAETRTRVRQQEAVARLGQRALTVMDMEALLADATELVTQTLGVELSSFLELMPDQAEFRIRASKGYARDVSLHRVPLHVGSQAGYALLSNTPTIVDDLQTEIRFSPSQLLLEHGAVSGVTVIVHGYEQPLGTLSAHTVTRRVFTQNDVHFLQAMANVLAAAMDRYRIETEIRQLNAQLKETNEQLRVENIDRIMAMGALREVTGGLERAKEEAEQARHEAEAANLAKSEFLSRMSHELRTPLNAILGFGQILELQQLTPRQHENIGYILKGGHHLLSLINEVLDIARVEAGHIELSIEPIALDEIVAECCALVRPLAGQRDIRLVNELLETGESQNTLHAMADRQRLKQVLINLLSNAIKYNRPVGEVLISISQTPDQRVQLRVRDSGVGLTPENVAKLFTPFERLNAFDLQIEGTGLGLVLSKRLAIAMGGTLGVESQVGQGSTFWIELPQAESPLKALAETLASQPPEILHEGGRTYTVLSIEDNLSNIRLLEAILESRPEISLLTAMQGSIGLELARQHRPDLILLDLNLPGLSGSEVLQRLQEFEETKEIPVIIISADATPTQIERLLASGARAYLTKPLNIGELLSLLDEALRKGPRTEERTGETL